MSSNKYSFFFFLFFLFQHCCSIERYNLSVRSLPSAVNIQFLDAAKNNDLEGIKKALQNGALINYQDDDGYAALHYVQDPFIVHFLLVSQDEKGHTADPTIHAYNKLTPLFEALLKNNRAKVWYLITAGANPNVLYAVHGKKEKEPLWTPLQYAIEQNDYEFVLLFLKKDAQLLDRIYYYVLNLDATYANTVQLLRKYKEYRAFKEKRKRNINALIDKKRNRLFHIVALHEDYVSADALLSLGAFIDARNDDGMTPLHVAVIAQRTAMVEHLLENIARVNEQDIFGNTPLHYAIMNGSEEIVKLLLKFNAFANTKNNDGFTPRDIANNKKLKAIQAMLS